MAITKSNYVNAQRATIAFDTTIPSGSPTSAPFPYELGGFALGTVSPSAGVGNTGHLCIKGADVWGIYRVPKSYSGNFSDWVIQLPSAALMYDMPPAWFHLVGSAQLWLTDGSGSGMVATALATFAVSLKS